MLLKPAKKQGGLLGKFYGGFNKGFEKVTNGYVHVSRLLVRRAILTIALVGVVIVGAGYFGKRLPAGFIPDEDQGIFGVNVQLPPAASLERTSAVLAQVEQILSKTEGIESYQTIGGYGVVTSTYQPNFGTIFARLKPWEERHGEALHVKGIMAKLQRELAGIPEAIAFRSTSRRSGFGIGLTSCLQDHSSTISVALSGAIARSCAARHWGAGQLFTSSIRPIRRSTDQMTATRAQARRSHQRRVPPCRPR
jgi:HAE1 family hydrophobic/amphiphilic exporter-1